MSEFQGFEIPDQNWSKLPHSLIDQLSTFKSKAELVVVLYILRHTWGFSEYGKPKRITLDEFENGRKKADGTRLDAGVGMSRPSIIKGLAAAAEHGFIEVQVDDSDAARVKKFYAPHIKGSKNFTPDVKKLDTQSQETLPRTEKETIRKKPKKSSTAKAVAPPRPSPTETPKKARQLREQIPKIEGRKRAPAIAKFAARTFGLPYNISLGTRLIRAGGGGIKGALAAIEAIERTASEKREGDLMNYACETAKALKPEEYASVLPPARAVFT